MAHNVASTLLKRRIKNRKLPSLDIPQSGQESIDRAFARIGEYLRTYEGDSGAPLERFVTLDELETSGLLTTRTRQGFATITKALGVDVTLTKSTNPTASSGGIASGATLAGLADTNTRGARDRDILMFNGQQWTNQGSIGASIAFDDLSDIDLFGAANNDLLFRSGGLWADTAGLLTWDGNLLKLWNSAATDNLSIGHDGTDVNWAHVNTADWNITGITSIQAGTVAVDFAAITATSYGGIVEANLVDKTAAETITGQWTFTSANGPVIESAQAELFIRETDAGADEGNWAIRASGGALYFVTATDAAPNTSANLPLSITRSGVGPGDVRIRDGFTFRVYNSGDTDYQQSAHDGTDFNTTHVNTADWNITGITSIQAGTVAVDFDAITATSYGGITEADLVDKSAVESIAGVWTFTGNEIVVTGVSPRYSFVETGGTADEGKWDWIANTDQLQLRALTDAGVAVIALQITRTANVVDEFIFTGGVRGTTIGQITEANLVDKSATETIAGSWVFAPIIEFSEDITMADLLGDRITIYGVHDGAAAYALGIESGTLYSKAGTNHRWYLGVNADGGVSDSMQLNSGGLTVAGDVSATSLGGITEANLLDKSADESISGSWSFNNQIFAKGLGTNPVGTGGRIAVSGGVTYWDSRDFTGSVWTPAHHRASQHEFSAGNIVAGSIAADFGAITGTSYGGITEANLLDKTAAETITGSYIFNEGAGDSFVHIVSSTGDAALFLQADTDNNVETDNPFIRFEQDAGAVLSIIGSVGGADVDAQGNVFTGMPDNGFAIHHDFTGGTIGIGVNNAVGLTIDDSNNVDVVGALTATSFTGSIAATSIDSGVLPVARLATPPVSHSVQWAFANYDRAGVAEDFNDFMTAGIYGIFGTSNTNAPTGENYDVMFVGRNGGDVGVQLMVPRTADRAMAYRGWSSSGTFIDWQYAAWGNAEGEIEGALDVTGALTAVSYGGIVEANLVDKTATETVSGAWTFTSNPFISNTAPGLNWDDTNQVLDEKRYRILAAGGDMLFQFRNDADDTSTTWLKVVRNAMTVTSVDVSGPLTATSYGGITEADLLNKSATETVSGRWDFTNTASYGFQAGINGNYSSTGNSALWGATIWGIDTSFDGATAGDSNTSVSLYGLKWLRASHAEADSNVGEGLYIYNNGNQQAGMGSNGIWTNGTLNVGAITATSYGGITEANLVDKSATEAIGGAWTFSSLLNFDRIKGASNNSGTELDIELTANANIGATANLNFFCDTDNDSTGAVFNWYTDAYGVTAGTLLMTLTDDGALSGTVSIEGILAGNLLDKSAIETVSGAWTFTDKILAGDATATQGSTIIEGPYSGANILNIFGAEYSSGATVLGFAARPNNGSAGFDSSAGNASFGRAVMTMGSAGFDFLTTSSATVAIGSPVTLVSRMTIANAGTVNVVGGLTALSFGGITSANLLDKTATESISGQFTFTNNMILSHAQPKFRIQETGLGTDLGNWLLRLNGGDIGMYTATDAAPQTIVNPAWIARRGATTTVSDFDIAATNISMTGITNVVGALTATSYGGITEANLLDKTASEAIAGSWTFNSTPVSATWGCTAVSSRDKLRVYSSTSYAIGMQSNVTYGGLNNDWAMTFQFNDDADRGFWWGDSAHTTAQGAMALTTEGKLTVAHSIRLGYGETETTIPGATYALDVSGDTKFDGAAFLKEQAAASTDAAAYGQFWTLTQTPNVPMFTDDAGTDQNIDPSVAVQNTQNTSYTLVIGDKGKMISKQSGGAGETITIPANSAVAFAIGTMIAIDNSGGGALSIAITTDTLVWANDASTGTRTLADDGLAIIMKTAATIWKIAGEGLS